MIRDAEDLLKAVRAHVMLNLNVKIAAINIEKDDDFKIQSIKADSQHYLFAAELLEIPNHTFVNFAFTEIISKQVRGNLAIEPSIQIEVVFDNPKDEGTMYKSLRYMRALYESLSNFDISYSEVTGVQIDSLKPMMVPITGRELIVSGVSFSCGISS